MAKKFCIKTIKMSSNAIYLQLQGDFDGTSAHELANTLSRCLHKAPGIAVDTDRLRTVAAFGLDVFNAQLKLLGCSGRKIDFTGRFGTVFGQERSC